MEKEREVLVSVQNVSKKFSKNLKSSLKYGASDIIRSTLGLSINKELRPQEFWAVKDVSFELARGECIGLIGHNGAGKSSLLKVLNGLYAPDKGQIVMKGKIGALIELGAGFNPILTGRENIYNNASILGFTKKEVEEKIQSIIDFSEISDFIDTPVQNYSSGMKVRLGFAVAAHLEPDILIVDEVLAVGDLGFILKCFSKIDELLPHTAVIFVSHSMPMISRICNEIILMDHGKVEYQGNEIGKGIQLYYNKFSNNSENKVYDNGILELISVQTDLINNEIHRNQDFNLAFEFRINKPIDELPTLYLEFKDKEQKPIAGISVQEYRGDIKQSTKIVYKTTVKNPLFTLGKYIMDVGLYNPATESPYLRINNILEFTIGGEKEQWIPFELDSENIITLQ
ncbi:lipopolysaccharide transport system ATP-binding protein [Chryseobacterium oranimense]|uniref:Lipopolysaccharide transport system ATP-binding protein n=1 Tax=Chryseobacterium oranimense TaxID=421058 RepID=A0A1M5P697_9FLAO|nr:ABC transporter ATP-binding protein [Chryseobacterium oranimense]SHG97245.1 lipopolysaccharide transport system ATP-binding protein [Chryseobacterium oranimense]